MRCDHDDLVILLYLTPLCWQVDNWWDDVEKFGAINARFTSLVHGIRFELQLHTVDSWNSFTTHAQYMRFKFDTDIKTDFLFAEVSTVTHITAQHLIPCCACADTGPNRDRASKTGAAPRRNVFRDMGRHHCA